MSAQAAPAKRTATTELSRKFIQISSGQPFGQGLTLFALDEAGDVWQIIPGREDQWKLLPRVRSTGHPASR